MAIIEETLLNQVAYHNFVPEVTIARKGNQAKSLLLLGIIIVGSGLLLYHYLKKEEEEKNAVEN